MAHTESNQPVAGVAIRQLLGFTYKGRIYDLACGSGGIFIHNQESNATSTTRRRVICGIRIRDQ